MSTFVRYTAMFVRCCVLAAVLVAGVAQASPFNPLPGAPQDYLEDIGPALVYPVSAPIEDSPYSVSINGEHLPIAPAGHIEPAYYVRFEAKEPLTLDIQAELPEDHELNLQPRRYRNAFEGDNSAYTLDIDDPGPRVFMMETPDGRRHTPLIILVEPPARAEEIAEDARVFDMSELANGDPEAPVTEEIQEALDASAEEDNGGVVFFGPGVYYTGHLAVGDNTMFYLAPGAELYAQPNWAEAAGTDPHELVRFDGATNSGFAGHGVIDGNGHIIRGTEREVSVTLSRAFDCREFYARDVMLRNAAGWTFHIVGCTDVDVDGVRVAGDWGVANTDGINPDNSQHVRIANVFVSGGDDPLCVKATDRYGLDRPARNIEIRDSVVMTLKTSLKLGTESRSNIENVLFENIDVIHSSRGLALWMRDGHAFSNVVFRDIRMDLLEFEGEAMSGEPFRFCIQDRDGGGHIRNILVEDVQVTAPYRAVLTGRPEESSFENVVFRNVDWTLTPCHLKPDPKPLTDAWVVDSENELPLEGKPLMAIHRAENIVFEDVTLTWGEPGEVWDRFADQQETARIDLDGVTHVDPPFAVE